MEPCIDELYSELSSQLVSMAKQRSRISTNNQKLSLGKVLGTVIAGLVTITTITAAILQPEEARSCVVVDARGCPFLRIFSSGDSEVGADYRKLREFLKEQNFEEANLETGRLLLWLAAREKEGFIDADSMKRLPCEDLRTINRLWFENSNGRFGFRVQQSMYQDLAKSFREEPERNEAFGNIVGWRTNNQWLNAPQDLLFELRAPKGHLPARYGEGTMSAGWLVYPVVSGLAACSLSP